MQQAGYDSYNAEGIRYGDIGYIIETYNDAAYEVEFSDMTGMTKAQIVAYCNELEVCEPTPESTE